PSPRITSEPWSTPPCTGPVRPTAVFQAYAGPRRSSAAVVVTSLKTEAGFMGRSPFHSTSGAPPATGCTQRRGALRGAWARSRAATRGAGRPSPQVPRAGPGGAGSAAAEAPGAVGAGDAALAADRTQASAKGSADKRERRCARETRGRREPES